MRVAIAQINPTLGDFKGNRQKILERTQEALEKGARLVVFPECALFGYHPFDLLERRGIVARQLKELKVIEQKLPSGIAALVGLLSENKALQGRPFFNSAVLLEKGKKPKWFHKTLLPTGDVFDEARFIEPSDMSKNHFTLDGHRIFVSICEDMWAWPEKDGTSSYRSNPMKKIPRQGWDLVVNLSASPWHVGKLARRHRVAQKTAEHFKAPFLYANLVGAQDEIVFDGRSFLMNPKGKVLFECAPYEEDLNLFNVDSLKSWTPSRPQLSAAEDLRSALILGIRDFCAKTGLRKVHLGLSGGIDSAVVAALATDALGPGAVHGIGMPGPFSSPASLELAAQLAKNLQIGFEKIEIEKAYDRVLETLSEAWDLKTFGLVHENLQARLRGLFLMAYSNKENSLLLTTGNKSEYATGYSTLYGDMCGGLAPIADLTKKQVYDLARAYNLEREVIPTEIIERAPSAELRPNQKDQDSLPPYDVLDKAVVNVVEKSRDLKGTTEKWLLSQIFRTEFKRWQAPPILKVSFRSFGRGRRFPVAHHYRED